jgi:multidrug efflux pump subunit AcrA (membrane-fusion protein)
MHPRLAVLVSIPLVTLASFASFASFASVAALAACAGDPPLPPAPLAPTVSSAPPVPTMPVPAAASSVSSPPPGEHRLTASAAAAVGTGHPSVPTALSVAAQVDLDEHHRAPAYAARSGIVAEIDVIAGQRVKKGAVLFSISHGPRPAEPVRALIDGEVDSIDVHVGDAVTGAEASGKEATRLAAVVDLGEVIVVAVPPPGAALGAKSHFAAEAFANRVYEGVVTFVAPNGQTLQVRMQNADHALRPGMRGALLVELPESWKLPFEGVEVPRSALVGGASRVLVKGQPAPDGTVPFVETPVTIAFDGGGRALVVRGLTKDAEIAWSAAAVGAH